VGDSSLGKGGGPKGIDSMGILRWTRPISPMGLAPTPHAKWVGVFAEPDALEAAVDELQIAGFDRTTVSVLARDKTVKERAGHLYDAVREVEDEAHVAQSAFASSDCLVEGEAAAVGVPIYILGCAGAVAAVASAPHWWEPSPPRLPVAHLVPG
jgi:hypothetical protein